VSVCKPELSWLFRFVISPRFYAVLSETPHESTYKSMDLKAVVYAKGSIYRAIGVSNTWYGGINPQIDLMYVCFLQGRVYNPLKNRKFHEVSAGIPCVAWEKPRYGKVSILSILTDLSVAPVPQY
jgi:hypothetical protein